MMRNKPTKSCTIKTAFRRQGFTGKVYGINLILVWVTVYICILLTALSGVLGITDTSVFSTIIQCAFAELGVFTGFFVWKAKTENCRKYKDANIIGENDFEDP